MTIIRCPKSAIFAIFAAASAMAILGCAGEPDAEELGTDAEVATAEDTDVASAAEALTVPTKSEIDAYAKAHGFPNSDYPWWEKANGCGSDWYNSYIPDGYPAADFTVFTPCVPTKNFSSVSFVTACNNHDHCYGTVGKAKATCDTQLGADISASCTSRLKSNLMLPCAPLPGIFLRGDAGSLARCKTLAAAYQTAVSAAGASFYANGQAQAQAYKRLVDAYVASRQ